MSRDVWTFRLVGGQPIDARAEWPYAVPSDLVHGGRGTTSVWTLRLTAQEAKATEAVLVDRGVRVLRWCETETEEQKTDRDRVYAAQSGEVSFLTERCPGCFWADVLMEPGQAVCGLDMWPVETVRAALDAHERASTDAMACPLGETRPARPG